MYSSLLSMKAPSNRMIHGCGGSVCSSLTSLMHRSRAFASIVSKIETFLSATRFASELRVARCTTEKWPRPMAFSTVKSSSVPPPKSRPDALAEPSAMLSNGSASNLPTRRSAPLQHVLVEIAPAACIWAEVSP